MDLTVNHKKSPKNGAFLGVAFMQQITS